LQFQDSDVKGAVLHIVDGVGKIRTTPSSSIFLCCSLQVRHGLLLAPQLRQTANHIATINV
jgi:hypothetical protein